MKQIDIRDLQNLTDDQLVQELSYAVERKLARLARRLRGSRRARGRGRQKAGADPTLVATAVSLARLAVLGITADPGGTWAVRPARARGHRASPPTVRAWVRARAARAHRPTRDCARALPSAPQNARFTPAS